MITEWLGQLRSDDFALLAFALLIFFCNELVLYCFGHRAKRDAARMNAIEACVDAIRADWSERRRKALEDKS